MSLNKTKLWSIFKGFLISGTAAGLTYIIDNISELELGNNQVWVVAMFGILIQTLRKLLEKEEVKNV